MDRVYKRKNYDYQKERIRKIKQIYGPTAADDYEKFHALQNGLCAVCSLPETRPGSRGGVSPLVIDHDHATGRIRGLLCNACNQALGQLQENPDRIQALLSYVEERCQ